MRVSSRLASTGRRRGATLIVAVVALAVVSVLATTTTWQLLAGRRLVERRHDQIQAQWLALAGIDLAAARLLDGPGDYKGESVEPIPGSMVRIVFSAEPAQPGFYRATSEASFPKDGQGMVVRSITRRLKRTQENGTARIEILIVADSVKEGSVVPSN